MRERENDGKDSNLHSGSEAFTGTVTQPSTVPFHWDTG